MAIGGVVLGLVLLGATSVTAQKRGRAVPIPPSAQKQLDDIKNGTGTIGRWDPRTGKPEVDANGKEKRYTATELEAVQQAEHGPPPEPPAGLAVPGANMDIVGITGSYPVGSVQVVKVWRNGSFHIVRLTIVGETRPGMMAVDQTDAARQLPPFDPRRAAEIPTPAQEAEARAAVQRAGGAG